MTRAQLYSSSVSCPSCHHCWACPDLVQPLKGHWSEPRTLCSWATSSGSPAARPTLHLPSSRQTSCSGFLVNFQFDSMVNPHPPEGRVGSEAVELCECLQTSLSHQIGDGIVPACAARHSRVHSNGSDEMGS